MKILKQLTFYATQLFSLWEKCVSDQCVSVNREWGFIILLYYKGNLEYMLSIAAFLFHS